MKKFSLTLMVLAVLGSTVGCADAPPEERIAAAKAHLEKHDAKTAAIELKNALQKKPDLPEARFLLAKALLAETDPVAAVVELKKASQLGYPDKAVVPLLARAMLASNEASKVTQQYTSTDLLDAPAMVDLRTSLAMAYAAQGNNELARQYLASALRLAPDDLRANVFLARLHVAAGDPAQGFKVLESLLARAGTHPDVLQLQGDMLWHAKADADGALAAYKKALALSDDAPTVHAAIVDIELARNDLKAARAQLDQLRKVRPALLQVKFFETELALRDGNLKAARDAAQQLVKHAPDNARVLQLAGAVELEMRSLLRAEQFLGKALQVSPDLPGTRELLARTHVVAGKPAQAIAVLQPVLDGHAAPSAPTLSLAASAYLQAGDVQKAVDLYTRAVKADPTNAGNRTALAMTNFARGKPDIAFGQLQAIAGSDTSITADLALVNAHLIRNDIDRALQALDGMDRKQPDPAMSANLRGKLLLMKGDAAGARAQFERALAADPAHFQAIENLAALDVKEQRTDQAQARLRKLLERDPRHVPALLALAHLRESARAPQAEVVELLSKAVNAQPAEAKPRLMLVSYQLAKGNVKQALTEAQKATAALPDSIELLDLLGRAQLVSGDAFQAVNTFNRLASLQPQAPKPLLSLAEAYVAAGDRPAAQQSLRRALAVAPDFVPAQQRLIAMEMQATRSDAALKIARTMQAQHADSPAGFEVEGDIHAAGKKWDPSAAAYRQALKRQPSGQTARKLHGTLVAGGKRADAAAFAADWMKRNPKDSAFLFHLANMSIHARELPQAEKHLQDLVALEPDNAAALNNLAWTTAQLHKPGALEYSQKATRLVPNNAEYMDTMATILAGEKQLDKAVDVQKKAVALEPRNDALRLNLARLYVAAGEAELARKELDRLSGSGDKTPYRKEVQELRARL